MTHLANFSIPVFLSSVTSLPTSLSVGGTGIKSAIGLNDEDEFGTLLKRSYQKLQEEFCDSGSLQDLEVSLFLFSFLFLLICDSGSLQ